MVHIGLAGDWEDFSRTVLDLVMQGHTLGPTEGVAPNGPAVVVAAVRDHVSLERAAELSRMRGLPWVALDLSSGSALTAAAYQRGALAVLPGGLSGRHLGEAIRNTTSLLQEGKEEAVPQSEPIELSWSAGQIVSSTGEYVLELTAGVVATRASHPDGAEVLLNLAGPGRLILTHPSDPCHIETVAHTDIVAVQHPWFAVARSPELVDRLRSQVLEREAWAAMQARTHVEDRILGVLALLADRFGTPHLAGTLVDVHLTHSQLASATGTTRPTVTRQLSRLYRTGRLSTTRVGRQPRFILSDGAITHR